jgi:O-antigen/teichoic acid export membrane protein
LIEAHLLSLKKNIFANYVSQLYVTGVGILILPLYIQYMGAEAYGLVGFFTMLQAWFGLLDMGLTPTIGRETARYHGGSMTALNYRQLFRALSLIFATIALVGGGALWLAADSVATQWLKVDELGMGEVVVAVQIMAISVALRWMGGLYRGVVTGAEKLVWLSGFNALIATLRFIAVFATMWLYGFTPFVFFIHQLVVALLEVVGLFAMSTCLIPSRHNLEGAIGWSFHPVKPVLKFALTIAFTSSVWILVTQTDKLVLSGILPLAEYGYFTLAVLVASGIMVITMPISSAIMPRMARLHAEGKHAELIQIYRNATQLVSVIAGSAAITIAFYAEPLLYAWTGDRELAAQSTPILRLYAIGNGFLSLAAFAYYLQYALGNLRYHLIGNAVMVVTLLPTVIIAATYWGGVGAGYVWVAVNGLFLFAWVGYVHHKLQPKLHQVWIWNDIVCIILPVAFVLGGVFYINVEFSSRLMAALYIIAISVMAIVTGVFSSRYMRVFLLKRLFVN